MHFIYLPFEASLQTPDRFSVIYFIHQVLQYYRYFMSITLVHDAFMHSLIISFVRAVLRVLSKYSPGLLIWPDVDEGDLLDEEFDSESDT